jgi:hypothetical protein
VILAMQRLVNLAQADLGRVVAEYQTAKNGAALVKRLDRSRGSKAKPAASILVNGWPADPEERRAEMKRVEHDRVPPSLAKKFRARYGTNPTPYRTLVIEPLKQILRHEGRSDQVGVAKAMHICRGHSRDYREGRGLFGKYKQLKWTPQIVRGSRGRSVPAPEVEVRI